MTTAKFSLDVLYDDAAEPPQTAAERRYGAPLRFPTRPAPYVVSNFVTTVDGVASLDLDDGTDSSAISAHSAADRFVMAMLRAAADAVVVGVATLRASVGHQWLPAALDAEHAGELEEYRVASGRPMTPAPLVVVTGSGQLPEHVAIDHPVTEVVVITTRGGAAIVARTHPRVRCIAIGDGQISGAEMVDTLHRELGVQLVLCEGGPRLLGSLLEAHCVREVFLTISPRIAGRDDAHPRPGMVAGYAALADSLPALVMASARRAEHHLLLRYRMNS